MEKEKPTLKTMVKTTFQTKLLKKDSTDNENRTILKLIKVIEDHNGMTLEELHELQPNTRGGLRANQVKIFLSKHSDIFNINSEYIATYSHILSDLTFFTKKSLRSVMCRVDVIIRGYGFLLTADCETIYFGANVFEDGATEDLTKVLDRGDIVVVDARSARRYANTHWKATRVNRITDMDAISSDVKLTAHKTPCVELNSVQGEIINAYSLVLDDETLVIIPSNFTGESEIRIGDRVFCNAIKTANGDWVAKKLFVSVRSRTGEEVEPKPKPRGNGKTGRFIVKHVGVVDRLFANCGFIKYGYGMEDAIYFSQHSVSSESYSTNESLTSFLREGDEVICNADVSDNFTCKYIASYVERKESKLQLETEKVSLPVNNSNRDATSGWRDDDFIGNDDNNSNNDATYERSRGSFSSGRSTRSTRSRELTEIYSNCGRVVKLFPKGAFIQRNESEKVFLRIEDSGLGESADGFQLNDIVHYDAVKGGLNDACEWRATVAWREPEAARGESGFTGYGWVLCVDETEGLITFGEDEYDLHQRVSFYCENYRHFGQRVRDLRKFLWKGKRVRFEARACSDEMRRTSWVAVCVWSRENKKKFLRNCEGEFLRSTARATGVGRFEDGNLWNEFSFSADNFFVNSQVVERLDWCVSPLDKVTFDAVDEGNGRMSKWKAVQVWIGDKPVVVKRVEKVRKVGQILMSDFPVINLSAAVTTVGRKKRKKKRVVRKGDAVKSIVTEDKTESEIFDASLVKPALNVRLPEVNIPEVKILLEKEKSNGCKPEVNVPEVKILLEKEISCPPEVNICNEKLLLEKPVSDFCSPEVHISEENKPLSKLVKRRNRRKRTKIRNAETASNVMMASENESKDECLLELNKDEENRCDEVKGNSEDVNISFNRDLVQAENNSASKCWADEVYPEAEFNNDFIVFGNVMPAAEGFSSQLEDASVSFNPDSTRVENSTSGCLAELEIVTKRKRKSRKKKKCGQPAVIEKQLSQLCENVSAEIVESQCATNLPFELIRNESENESENCDSNCVETEIKPTKSSLELEIKMSENETSDIVPCQNGTVSEFWTSPLINFDEICVRDKLVKNGDKYEALRSLAVMPYRAPEIKLKKPLRY